MSHDCQPSSTPERAPVARRRLLAGAAGAAGAAAAVAVSRTAQAADGDTVLVGGEYTADTATEIDITTGPAPAGGDLNAFRGVVSDTANASDALVGSTAGDGAGVGGRTTGGGHAVAGDTAADATDVDDEPNTAAAVIGRHAGAGPGVGGESAGGYGGEFAGGLAHLRLIQTVDPDTSGPPTGAGHLLGELYVDPAGNLWFNRSDGEDFTRLNDQGGITMFTDSQRAFDSREEFPDPANTNKGRFSPDEIRVVDLTEFTDLPVGATGAVINLTVAETGAPGFVLVFNGDTADADIPNSSSINWVTAGDVVANGVIVPVGATGTVKVFALEETEVIIDVVGYIGSAGAPTPPPPAPTT